MKATVVKSALIGAILYTLLFVGLSLVTGTGISLPLFIAIFFYGGIGTAMLRIMW